MKMSYFKIYFIAPKSLFYPLSKQAPIENRANSKPTYQFSIRVDGYI